MRLGVAGAICAALSVSAAATPIVFDDFNASEGHFGYAPGFASQSVGEATTSTADRVTSDSPFEGDGHQKLVLVHDGGTTAMRIRHLSGASPFGSGQAGAPASNVPFTTTSGDDGFIGFYFKTTAQGWTIALNLDGSDGAGASMDMGHPKTVIGDGAWHLYEWSLDDDAQWDIVTSIGGDGTIQNEQHTIDSIYIFTNATGTNGQAQPDAFLDFVAKSDTGTIAALVPAVPEPGMLSLAAIGALGLMGRRRKTV
jgi:hypothetical protein